MQACTLRHACAAACCKPLAGRTPLPPARTGRGTPQTVRCGGTIGSCGAPTVRPAGLHSLSVLLPHHAADHPGGGPQKLPNIFNLVLKPEAQIVPQPLSPGFPNNRVGSRRRPTHCALAPPRMLCGHVQKAGGIQVDVFTLALRVPWATHPLNTLLLLVRSASNRRPAPRHMCVHTPSTVATDDPLLTSRGTDAGALASVSTLWSPLGWLLVCRQAVAGANTTRPAPWTVCAIPHAGTRPMHDK